MTKVAMVYHRRDQVNIERRPKRSAAELKRIVPKKSPANVLAAKVAWSERPNSP